MATDIDIDLLRQQRDWLLSLDPCDEREGLVNLLDHLLDVRGRIRLTTELFPRRQSTDRRHHEGTASCVCSFV